MHTDDQAELTIRFHVNESKSKNIRDFDDIVISISNGYLTEQIRELLKENLDPDETYSSFTLTQKLAEIRRDPDETD